MKLFRKIDTVTGNFLEDMLFESQPFLTETVTEEITHEDGTTETIETVVNVLDDEGQPIQDQQYIEEAPQQGFYRPRWNGEAWVEGGVAPEKTEPEPQVPTIEEVAIALMNMQAELKATTEALDFLLMGGM